MIPTWRGTWESKGEESVPIGPSGGYDPSGGYGPSGASGATSPLRGEDWLFV